MKALGIALSVTLGLATATTVAEPPTASVNISNTPLPVTVQNPQTSVTVDNESSNPVPVTVQGDVMVQTEPRFVGFSDDRVQGDVGLVGMHTACRNKYGGGARMCLDIEVFKTPDLQPNPSNAIGWVQPANEYVSSSNKNNCIDWTYRSATATGTVLSGQRMQLAGTRGVQYLGGRRISRSANCDEALPVACCQ
jgi:hypothetical protein